MDLVTRHHLYKSMVMTSISADTTSPFAGKLTGRVSFKQYNEINIQVVAVPASTLNGTAKQSASSQIDAGRQEGEPISEDNGSFLSQLFG